MNTLQTIISQLLGPGIIDVSIIVGILVVLSTYMQIQVGKKEQKNTAYNAELKRVRTEIYTNFEKNFFL